MIELIIGSIIGAAVTFVAAEIYFRRSSRDLNKQIENLDNRIVKLNDLVDNLENWQELHSDNLQIIKKHAVAGTVDDPEYPYK
jgi:gas vesicle protein